MPPETFDVEPLFRHGGLLISRWRCRVREAGATSVLCHQWHVMKFVHTGAFRAHLSEGVVHVDSTRTLLVAPREAYMVTRQFGPDVAGSAIAVSPELMLDIIGERSEARTQLLGREVTPRALLTQHLILRQIEEGAPPLAIEELALMLAAESFRDPSAEPRLKRRPTPARRDAVEMAQAILAANYEKPVRLQDIARAVDVSPYHLCREFRRVTGMRMHEYLNCIRLRAALEHVAEPRLRFAEIAHHHGFSSHSHFAAAFRKEFLITPSEVRRLSGRKISEMRRALGFGTENRNFLTPV
jgi:AraC family transcriptional regulator